MHQVVDSILLRDRQLRVLEETSSILVGHSILVEDVESDDPDLVDPTRANIEGEQMRERLESTRTKERTAEC